MSEHAPPSPPALESRAPRRPAAAVPSTTAPTVAETDVVAFVETDRYCDACGYNLITLPVFREPNTGLFLVKCTECGAMHPAGLPTGRRPVWASRVAAPLLFVWMGLILLFLFITGVITTAMQAVAFETLTTGYGANRLPYTDFPEFPYFVGLVWGVSLMMGLLQVTLLSTVAHHWRRWGYFVAAILFPCVPLAIAYQAWRMDAAHLLDNWALQILLSLFGAAMVGGLLGAMFGRKVMRMFASLLLPPRVRQLVVFLWLADGLTPPKMSLKQSRTS